MSKIENPEHKSITTNVASQTRSNEDLQSHHRSEPVELADGKTIEAPVSTPSVGTLYKNVEEVMPELGFEPLTSQEIQDSHNQPQELAVDRRDFMRLFGTTAVAATAAGCVRREEEKALTYVDQPLEQTQGLPNHYATTCGECSAGCGVVVKTKEGRPVKIEGNPEHELSLGGSCALGQSTLQTLYSPDRRRTPTIKRGNRVDEARWVEVYEHLASRIEKSSKDSDGNKKVAIFTRGSTGHQQSFYKEFLNKVGSSSSSLYTYEPNSNITVGVKAHEAVFGVSALPRPSIVGVPKIIGIGTDFLEVGPTPTLLQKQFSRTRRITSENAGAHSCFIQFDANLSATSAKADQRFVVRPGYEIWVALKALEILAQQSSGSAPSGQIAAVVQKYRSQIAANFPNSGVALKDLQKSVLNAKRQGGVFFCGSTSSTDENILPLHVVGILLNQAVGAYGRYLDISKRPLPSPVDTTSLHRFLNKAATYDVVLFIDSDPLHSLPKSFALKEKLADVGTIASMQVMPCSTDSLATHVLPMNHYLESWGDEQPMAGLWSMRQPAIRTITNSMQAEDVLLWVAAANGMPMGNKDYHDYLSKKWAKLQARSGQTSESPTVFWKNAKKNGKVMLSVAAAQTASRAVSKVADVSAWLDIKDSSKNELVLASPLDIRLQAGRGADRPVLQEVGDSMTSIAWGSWLAINPNTAKKLQLKHFDEVEVSSDAGTVKLGVFPMPGLHPSLIVIPQGNGHDHEKSKVSYKVGVNPLNLSSSQLDSYNITPLFAGIPVKIKATGSRATDLVPMQKGYGDIGNRTDVVRKQLRKNVVHAAVTHKQVDLDTVPDIYPKLPNGEYRWGMSVDINSCTGCSACMVACSVENNIPQIGRKLVRQGREMHWIRLDRYFEGPVDNPQVSIQPVMCQQCNHAPCEGVCPVYATTHDDEGINTQTYNRCVGTRYCANACPYKVRRFNWFTHKWNTPENPRPTNPDITVRTRGIMEKCTFCVQRIREAKHHALTEYPNKKVRDGDIKTACEQACPSEAIRFGNLLDGSSRISGLRKDSRAYLMLGGDPEHGHYGIKTLPNVSYLAQVVDKIQPETQHHGPAQDHAADGAHHGVDKNSMNSKSQDKTIQHTPEGASTHE